MTEVLHFDQIDWSGGGSAPAELVAQAEAAGARRKRVVTGQHGFYMNHSEMPPGFTVPVHSHDHDEVIVVLRGGCTVLGGGPELAANDAVVVTANEQYGFTCGPDGMTFLTFRNGEASVAL